MSRIGIVTFHHANNYGAVLQAYGLVKAIQDLGHEVQVIDYRPLAARKFYEGRLPRRPLRFLKEYRFRKNFNDFRRIYLPLTSKYLTKEDLACTPPAFDCVVCGSDQVWNVSATSYRGYDPAFFLGFLDGDLPRRVSYAATFGGTEMTDFGENKEEICSHLSSFHHLSVRDRKSQSMLNDLIHRHAEHVLDPCFLTDYKAITPRRLIKTPYILTYCFQSSPASIDAAQRLSKKLDLPIVSIKAQFDGATPAHPGPLQWLSLMQHASFVCTDSFHGACFSIINRKEFVVLPFEGNMSRIEDILDTAGLTNRIVRSTADLDDLLSERIDFDRASHRVQEKRNDSVRFLSNSLG